MAGTFGKGLGHESKKSEKRNVDGSKARLFVISILRDLEKS